MNCPFCPPFKSLIDYTVLVSGDSSSLFITTMPPIPGSCMIVPHRHIETPFSLSQQELQEHHQLLQEAKSIIDRDVAADAYTIGWNVGAIGGQHVSHAHLHIVPRYEDEPFAGRGLRYWFKSDANQRTIEPIDIVPANPLWRSRFLDMKTLLVPIVSELACSIDHIGSTSVPDLPAKDRIDIQITLYELSDSIKQTLDERLVHHGFPASRDGSDHRPPGDTRESQHWEKLFIPGTLDALSFQSNIHVRVKDRANQRYPLLFRDYLRSHTDAASCYAACKKIIATHHRYDRDNYSDIKDPICDLIMLQAEPWAASSSWSVDQAMEGL